MRSGTEQAEALRPYVPWFLIRWLRDDPTRRVSETEGSLAFVDISGFTKMCERLARRGKVGAEEINDVLDTCFTQLLSLAYEDGGGVLKWGGDAVLLLFTGPDHTARAARAAHRMRARLREIGRRLRTSAGLVSLRMSVGIHSGTFHLFLVGERHRELVITGPGATRTVAMESVATAGEIALSPEAAALLDPRALGATKGEARLLRSEPPGIPFSPRQSDEELGDVDLSSLIPLGIRDHLRETGAEAEHRQVAVAFLEFLGVDVAVVISIGLVENLGRVLLPEHDHGRLLPLLHAPALGPGLVERPCTGAACPPCRGAGFGLRPFLRCTHSKLCLYVRPGNA